MAGHGAAPILEMRGIRAGYGQVTVLNGVDIRLDPGEIVAVVGPNGAGKSTVLRVAVGILPPASGEVLLAGETLHGLPTHRVIARGVAYVPQGQVTFPKMTVAENMWLASEAVGIPRDTAQRAHDLCARLFPQVMFRYRQLAGSMSGGEQQMVALARALMTAPRMILLDEPSLGLSPKLVDSLFDKLSELRDEGISILLVEQNARAALEISNRGYVLDLGAIRFEGPAHELRDSPEVARLYLGDAP
jgi:ABC-type branched-subunit amino acid transport system ATPase component